jgi:hypothetical protein
MKRLTPWIMWAIALGVVAAATQELRLQRQLTSENNTLALLPRVTLTSTPLALSDYQAIQKKTPVSGTVELKASARAITVQASALSDYADWRLIVDQVLLDNPGVTWRIDLLCSGKCNTGEAHKAELTGIRTTVNPQETTPNSNPIKKIAQLTSKVWSGKVVNMNTTAENLITQY